MFTFLFDDNREGTGGLLFEAPRAVIRADEPGDVAQSLRDLEAYQSQGFFAAGFLSYELGLLLEEKTAPLLPPGRSVPLLMFGIYERPTRLSNDAVGDWLAAKTSGGYELDGLEPALSFVEYARIFARARDFIDAGDIYQINLTFKAKFEVKGSPAALFADLRRKQRVAYGALIETDSFSILSVSPELFIETDGRRLQTRPMKGTAPRGLTADEDERLRAWLAQDAKSRAENLMIVDLMRNDLARIARPGSVCVPNLYTVEAFETVLQMTSLVEADLTPGSGIREMLRALFPPGSVTGAPKIRAMEIIRELEYEPRGVYTGAIGILYPYRGARFNVAIRTIMIANGGRAELGIGSGVVSDSDARAEYDECLLKLRFLTAAPAPAFELLETMLWTSDGGYNLLDRHLARLEASARRFSFRFDRGEVATALTDHVTRLSGSHRVRFKLASDGTVAITSAALSATPAAKFTFAIARERMDQGNIFLYHKTTNRAFYDDVRVQMHREIGCDEVVFLNMRGELSEGSFTNIFLNIAGEMFTPPVASGLLAGTLRAELLERGLVQEAVLTLRDLERATAIFLGNSVRGLLPAELIVSPIAPRD